CFHHFQHRVFRLSVLSALFCRPFFLNATTTPETYTLSLHDALPILRHEENQLLALDREVVAAFPPRLRRMVGYGVYRGLIGHVDQVDPATWFDPGAETDLVWSRMR